MRVRAVVGHSRRGHRDSARRCACDRGATWPLDGLAGERIDRARRSSWLVRGTRRDATSPSSPTRLIAGHLAGEQPLAAREDRVEHRRRVRDRAADRRQHLAGRALLVERLLGLLEQPHVLERDRRLVAEGLQQRDLPLGERPHFLPAQQDRAERLPFAEQRPRRTVRWPKLCAISWLSGYSCPRQACRQLDGPVARGPRGRRSNRD